MLVSGNMTQKCSVDNFCYPKIFKVKKAYKIYDIKMHEIYQIDKR